MKPMNPVTKFEPPFITLKELANRFNQSEEYFLMQGATESLELVVRVPETADVGVTNFAGHVGKVGCMRHPDYLKIGLSEISEIRKAQSALIARSPMGYQLLQNGSLRRLTAHQGWDMLEEIQAEKTVSHGTSVFKKSSISMNEWTIKDSRTDGPAAFHRVDILIQTAELRKLKKELTEFVDVDLRHCHSKRVEHLFNASNIFWGEKSVDYVNRESHPDSKKIYEWFIARGFSQSLATAAVTIITPDDAKTRGPKPKTGPIHKLTKMSNSQPRKLVL